MASLPNTLIVGAAKSGTTSLCDDLARHPDIHLYHSKETNYFSFNYHRGETWFRSLFTPSGQSVILDGSPDYTTRGRTGLFMQRIRDCIPEARLILMVRHPVRRIESHYVQELANGREPLPLAEALDAWNLIDGSLYEKATGIIAQHFPPERLHTLFFEDYLADKPATLHALFDYLQIADHPGCSAPRAAANSRGGKVVDPAVIKSLRHLPAYYRLKGLVPGKLKARIKQIVAPAVRADIHWTSDAWQRTIAAITPDMAAFLARHDKLADYWHLELPDELE